MNISLEESLNTPFYYTKMAVERDLLPGMDRPTRAHRLSCFPTGMLTEAPIKEAGRADQTRRRRCLPDRRTGIVIRKKHMAGRLIE